VVYQDDKWNGKSDVPTRRFPYKRIGLFRRLRLKLERYFLQHEEQDVPRTVKAVLAKYLSKARRNEKPTVDQYSGL
jgi:hypothetical protein